MPGNGFVTRAMCHELPVSVQLPVGCLIRLTAKAKKLTDLACGLAYGDVLELVL